MSNKFNPNVSTFISNIRSTPSSSSSSSQSLSSHSTPPPTGIMSTNRTKSKKRESKVPSNNKPRPTGWFQDHQHHDIDKFDIHIEDEVIRGNFKARGRKGQISINHLLDFSSPASQSTSSAVRRPRRRSSNNHDDKRIHLTGSAFINANYRFVVDYRHDYRGQMLDPNLELNHHSILRVIVPKGAHNCPICLTDEIIAPRMISCGHIFCNTCLLNFLDSETIKKKDEFPKKFKDCPLCSESVKPDEILPVLINETDERFETPHIGHDVIMKLMIRPIDKILPIPRSLNLNHVVRSIPWFSDSELFPYARILKSGLKFVIDSFENDKSTIWKQFQEDKLLYKDDGKFVNKAISEIDDTIEALKKSFGEEINEEVINMDTLSISKNQSELNETNCYFFYQTCFHSTTRYFLSPFDVKILMATYGSYSNFPTTLLLKVCNVKYGQMVTDLTLKRYKYLNHLPLGTEFALIEVDWTDILTPEVYEKFAKELIDRKKKLFNKTKKEDREKQKFENEQELKTAEFYKNANNNGWDLDETIAIDDEAFTPALTNSNNDIPEVESVSTIWGTSIPKSHDDYIDDKDDLWDAEEIIRQSKEYGGKKKKGKKKLIVLSSTNSRAGF